MYSKIRTHQTESPKINRHLFNLERIEALPAYTFLLNIFLRDLNEKIVIEILRVLETFILRRHICEYRTAELDDIFASLVSVPDQNIITKIKEELKNSLPDDKLFKDSLLGYNFRRAQPRAKYILEMIEYYLISDQKEYVLSTGSDLHLEHIIPQTIDTKKATREFGNWISYLGDHAVETHKEVVFKIGNLTLLGQIPNIIASNNPFDAKLKEYRKTNLAITKEIIKKYEETGFRFPQLEDRGKYLSNLAPKIWSLQSSGS
jgi:hypothetical protein